VPIVLCYCLCGCQGKGKGNSAGELIDDAQELERLTQLAYWKPEQRKYAEAVKKCVIGEGRMAPASNHEGDPKAPCQWDCYRRASMLEPLVAEILQRGVPGDFVEAGVYRGGISVFMAALLRSAGVLGDTPSAGQRRMWLADSFQVTALPSRACLRPGLDRNLPLQPPQQGTARPLVAWSLRGCPTRPIRSASLRRIRAGVQGTPLPTSPRCRSGSACPGGGARGGTSRARWSR